MLPGWQVHRYLDRVFFKRSYYKVHRRMDCPVVYLGKKHRVLFHDPLSASLIAQGCYPGDSNAVNAAMLHISVDDLCTRYPDYKAWLERSAAKARKEQRDRRKESKNVSAIEKLFLEDLEKFALLQRLIDQVFNR